MARIDDPFALHAGAAETWRFVDERVLGGGIVDQRMKELVLRFVADPDSVEPDAFDDPERAALEWAYAIVWDADRATDELWDRLHAHFTEPELVELGCAIGFELGRTHFLRTLGVDPHAATS